MAPSGHRDKRVKPSPPGADSPSAPPSNNGSASSRQRSSSQRQESNSTWSGVWPTVSRSSKAAPVTEVARESISAAQNAVSNIASASSSKIDSPKQPRHLAHQLTRREGASSRSLPADVATTKINIASDGSASSPAVDSQPDPTNAKSEAADKEASNESALNTAEQDTQGQIDTVDRTANANQGAGSAEPNNEPPKPAQQSGWFSWLYSSSTTANNTPGDSAPPETTNPAETQPAKEEETDAAKTDQPEPVQPDKAPEVTEVPETAQKRSWLQMWYGSGPPKGPDTPQSAPPSTSEEPAPQAETPPSSSQELDRSERPESSTITPDKSNRSSGWSFWFRDPSKDPSSADKNSKNVEGVAASVTQDDPLKKSKNEPESDPEQKIELAKKGSVKIKSPKSSTALPDKTAPPLEPPPKTLTPEPVASKHLQRILQNQVLPHFRDTYSLQERPSLFQTIGRYFYYNKEPEHRHVNMIRDPPHIKKALAIGVHGYFPAPLIRSVLGQPTGTSIRFSNMAADAIHKWTEDHGYSCDIEKIALEGEGRIAERLDLLWKLLLNWMEEIRKADFILIACHSQGVPVAIMLVAKLINFGCLNAARVGICAMAGVNLGPFSDYRSRWISGSAGELFEFALPYSQVSKDYETALRTSLEFGVRITYIGSIDDQLVSLESSLFTPVAHPYVYRAVFVDGRVHAPSFLSHLVGFALKLRNLGIPDHGLIRELSTPLAGSLYTGEGHSRLYDDEAVYRLSIEFALETSTVSNAKLNIKRSQLPPIANPYILPFAMRGLLEEEHVRLQLYDETIELLRQFDEWKPTSKVLKDVKFRLEGIRSKL